MALLRMASRYIGSSPYGFSNALVMCLDEPAVDASAVEVLSGSPFGFTFVDGDVPRFEPRGWDPDVGLDAAIDLLGWTCARESGGDDIDAMAGLREAARSGPVLVGPVDRGLLGQHPASGLAIGADHFVVVLGVEAGGVHFHDPHGHPHATLPVLEFLAAWNTDLIPYAVDRFVFRHAFQRFDQRSLSDALLAGVPASLRWLGSGDPRDVVLLAHAVEHDLEPHVRAHMARTAVPLGARRLADAAHWMDSIGMPAAAAILARQAQLVGAVQYDLVSGQDQAAAEKLRRLAPSYLELLDRFAATGLLLQPAFGDQPDHELFEPGDPAALDQHGGFGS